MKTWVHVDAQFRYFPTSNTYIKYVSKNEGSISLFYHIPSNMLSLSIKGKYGSTTGRFHGMKLGTGGSFSMRSHLIMNYAL